METESGWVKEPQKRKQEERLDKILYSLDLSIRKSGRIQISEFDGLFNLIKSLRFCSPSQAVLLLKCCGEVLVDEDRKVRTGLVEKCLSLLKKTNGLTLDISHYNTLLKVGLAWLRVIFVFNFPFSRFTWRTRIRLTSLSSWLRWTGRRSLPTE